MAEFFHRWTCGVCGTVWDGGEKPDCPKCTATISEQKLRAIAADLRYPGTDVARALREAADEIERLRAIEDDRESLAERLEVAHERIEEIEKDRDEAHGDAEREYGTRLLAEKERNQIDARLVSLQCRVETLFDAIKHGDDNHQAWLEHKIKEHFA